MEDGSGGSSFAHGRKDSRKIEKSNSERIRGEGSKSTTGATDAIRIVYISQRGFTLPRLAMCGLLLLLLKRKHEHQPSSH